MNNITVRLSKSPSQKSILFTETNLRNAFDRLKGLIDNGFSIDEIEEELKIVLRFTDSDGVWLHCTCGWELCVGFDPDIEKILLFSGNHKKEAHK